jgi:hypothetical protein
VIVEPIAPAIPIISPLESPSSLLDGSGKGLGLGGAGGAGGAGGFGGEGGEGGEGGAGGAGGLGLGLGGFGSGGILGLNGRKSSCIPIPFLRTHTGKSGRLSNSLLQSLLTISPKWTLRVFIFIIRQYLNNGK